MYVTQHSVYNISRKIIEAKIKEERIKCNGNFKHLTGLVMK